MQCGSMLSENPLDIPKKTVYLFNNIHVHMQIFYALPPKQNPANHPPTKQPTWLILK